TGIRQRMEGVGLGMRASVALMERVVKATPTTEFVDRVMRLVGNPEVRSGLFGPSGKRLTPRAHQNDRERGRELWQRSEHVLRAFLPTTGDGADSSGRPGMTEPHHPHGSPRSADLR
ncbi:MAG: hypothetical protein ACRCY8_15610, partial [Dermatophilaceae bacterium]